MAMLAINGGKKIGEIKWKRWPIAGDAELKNIIEVVESGRWSYNGPKEREFNKKFAKFIGTKYAISAANGTVTLQIALEALGIGYGDEVIIPGMTWQADASCCIDVNAVPILVDVEEDTWCIDVKKLEESITSNTRAIIVVHLYGSNPKIDEIIKIAKKNNLFLIEDSAHQHGTKINGKRVGSFGDLSSFSFQRLKVLNCGEGGAITTDNKCLAEKIDSLRNCGRRPLKFSNKHMEIGISTDIGSNEGNFIHSGNYRITEFQAAILLGQLERLENQLKIRDKNAMYLNKRLAEIEGIKTMRREKGVELQSYFKFAFRYDKKYFKNLSINRFREALSKELDIAIEACYEPLNDCQLYRPLTKKRYYINDEFIKRIDPSRFSLPVCENAFKNESVTFHHVILLGEKSDMDCIADAIIKIKENVGELI